VNASNGVNGLHQNGNGMNGHSLEEFDDDELDRMEAEAAPDSSAEATTTAAPEATTEPSLDQLHISQAAESKQEEKGGDEADGEADGWTTVNSKGKGRKR